MPRPVYVILANSGANDQITNLVSLFDVVEIINVFQPPAIQPPAGVPVASLVKPNRIIAVWLKEEDDNPTDRFQTQLVCIAPDDTELFAAPIEEFVFASPFHRLTCQVQLAGFNVLGTHLIEARLRRAGEQEWEWSQSFPFIVQAGPGPVQPTPAATPEAQVG